MGQAKTALWWLSVDNAMGPKSTLRDEQRRRAWFRLPFLHLTQSAYAADWVTQNGRADRWMLGDYTDPIFTDHSNLTHAQRARRILFNPRKGGDMVKLLEPVLPDWEFSPLQGMSKIQLRELMLGSRYYIDFGHHPGKDRLPREAAASGCVVLTHFAGAARYFEDVPLEPTFKFAATDVSNGRLATALQQIDSAYEPVWRRQHRYRAWIMQEKMVFDAQVASVFV
jgi:hypothetical protein